MYLNYRWMLLGSFLKRWPFLVALHNHYRLKACMTKRLATVESSGRKKLASSELTMSEENNNVYQSFFIVLLRIGFLGLLTLRFIDSLLEASNSLTHRVSHFWKFAGSEDDYGYDHNDK
jgi:hypothetical protein